MTETDLVERVKDAMYDAPGGADDGGPYSPRSPQAKARAAIAAVYDDLEATFGKSSLRHVIKLKRKEVLGDD